MARDPQDLQARMKVHVAQMESDDPFIKMFAERIDSAAVGVVFGMVAKAMMVWASKFCDEFPDEDQQHAIVCAMGMTRDAHIGFLTAIGEEETLQAMRRDGMIPPS